jgi:amino acid adenylation domain-containing protein
MEAPTLHAPARPVAGSPVPARIIQWARLRPHQPAVVDGERLVSYAGLAASAGALAEVLRAHGAGRDVPVALYLPRSADLVIAATAVMVAGAAALPLDVNQPPARTRQLIADSGTRLVLTYPDRMVDLGGAARAVRGDPGGPVVVTLDPVDAAPPAATPPAEVAPAEVAASALAYITYTSGSTGTPKGVLVEHLGLANLVDWYLDRYAVTPADRMTQLARPSFDAFALEVWPCLAAGAALLIVDAALLQAPQRLAAWLHANAVTVCFVPTPLGERLMDLPWPRRPDGGAHLRAMLVGGDRLGRYPPHDLPFAVFNNYGPTECTVVATCGPVPAAPAGPAPGEPPSIGRPIPGVRAYVLNDVRRLVPDGEAGELYLGGVAVARGYLGAPELTARRFPSDPFSPAAGARMYATGDLVRRRPGGELSFLGRVDEQIKINGYRIEPAEVEAALRGLPGVRAAAVVAHRPDPDAPQTLVGYVVGGGGGAAVLAALGEHLPDYLVPAEIITVDQLPVDANGKVNRAALRAGALPASASADPPQTAPDEVAEAVVALWRDVLGVPQPGADESFFDLGGDSLRVIRLVSRARQRGLPLRPEDVHRHPVLADLIEAVRANRRAAA